jgi:hypothetical protein
LPGYAGIGIHLNRYGDHAGDHIEVHHLLALAELPVYNTTSLTWLLRAPITGLVLIFVFAVVPMEPDSILSGLLKLDRFLLMAMFLGVVHAIGLMAIETVFIAEYNWPQ